MANMTVFKRVIGNLFPSHKFNVVFPNLPGSDGTLLSFLVNNISSPIKEMITTEVSYRGRTYEQIVSDKVSGEISMTIRMDTAKTAYDIIYATISAISNNLSGIIEEQNFNYYIDTLDQNEIPDRRFFMNDCFFKNTGELTFAHDSLDIATFDTTVYHTSWTYGLPTPE